MAFRSLYLQRAQQSDGIMLLLQEKDVCVPLLIIATEEGQKVQPHMTTNSREVTNCLNALLLSFVFLFISF